MVGSKVEELLQ